MRAAYDDLDDETKAEIEDLVCEHSRLYSRSILGFTDFTDEDRERFKPVLHPVRHLIAFAKQLGRSDCASLLQQTLEEEKAADKKLTAIAESRVNKMAA